MKTELLEELGGDLRGASEVIEDAVNYIKRLESGEAIQALDRRSKDLAKEIYKLQGIICEKNSEIGTTTADCRILAQAAKDLIYIHQQVDQDIKLEVARLSKEVQAWEGKYGKKLR